MSHLARNTPPQFFVEPGAVSGDTVYLTGDALKRAISQRLQPGELFRVVIDRGQGTGPSKLPGDLGAGNINIIEAEMVEVRRGQLTGRIVRIFEAERPTYALHLYPAILKGDKFDLVVRGATELGVTSITPIVTARTIPRLEGGKLSARKDRWQRIAKAAAEQSSRAFIPEIKPAVRFADLFSARDKGMSPFPVQGLPLMAMEKRELTKSVSEAVGPAREVSVFIGPEGGFDAREVEMALDHGFQLITLGPHILKAETASLAACAIIIDNILHRANRLA